MTKINSSLKEMAQLSIERPFDCIIVGGGSAGMTMARTLIDHNPELRIIILEAGDAPFLTHISNTELRYSRSLSGNIRNQTAYNQRNANGENFGPFYGCLGGRGLFWNGSSPRFREHDFENWPKELDLNSNYDWAEREFRVNTMLGQTRLAKNIINNINENTNLSAIPGPFAVDYTSNEIGSLRAGIASGFSLFFRGIGQAIFDDNVRICINSFVTEIIHNGQKTSGVKVKEKNTEEVYKLNGRSVVLAAGGIESIVLVLKSKIPDKSGRIGRGIQEHLFYDCWFDGLHHYEKTPDTAVVFVPSSSRTSEQWELHAPGRSLFTIDNDDGWNPDETERYRIMIRSFCATDKNSDNWIELNPSDDLGGAIVHFSYSVDDERRKKQTLKNATALAHALNLEPIGDAVDDPDRFRAAGSSYHEACGLDMGTDANSSVTDINGEFHQMSNLISADAASFPEIGATNPHLTIVALANHKGIHLAKQLTN